jgi:hypothetical protein
MNCSRVFNNQCKNEENHETLVQISSRENRMYSMRSVFDTFVGTPLEENKRLPFGSRFDIIS